MLQPLVCSIPYHPCFFWDSYSWDVVSCGYPREHEFTSIRSRNGPALSLLLGVAYWLGGLSSWRSIGLLNSHSRIGPGSIGPGSIELKER